MTDDQFKPNINRFLDGRMDLVEWTEFRDHERQCRPCADELDKQFWQRLGDGKVTIDPPSPQPCLTDETLRRIAELRLPLEYDDLAEGHLDQCPHCQERLLALEEQRAISVLSCYTTPARYQPHSSKLDKHQSGEAPAALEEPANSSYAISCPRVSLMIGRDSILREVSRDGEPFRIAPPSLSSMSLNVAGVPLDPVVAPSGQFAIDAQLVSSDPLQIRLFFEEIRERQPTDRPVPDRFYCIQVNDEPMRRERLFDGTAVISILPHASFRLSLERNPADAVEIDLDREAPDIDHDH